MLCHVTAHVSWDFAWSSTGNCFPAINRTMISCGTGMWHGHKIVGNWSSVPTFEFWNPRGFPAVKNVQWHPSLTSSCDPVEAQQWPALCPPLDPPLVASSLTIYVLLHPFPWVTRHHQTAAASTIHQFESCVYVYRLFSRQTTELVWKGWVTAEVILLLSILNIFISERAVNLGHSWNMWERWSLL